MLTLPKIIFCNLSALSYTDEKCYIRVVVKIVFVKLRWELILGYHPGLEYKIVVWDQAGTVALIWPQTQTPKLILVQI